MALSALDDLSSPPSNDQLEDVSGSSLDPWLNLEDWLNVSAGITAWEWGSSGKKYGWDLGAKIGT